MASEKYSKVMDKKRMIFTLLIVGFLLFFPIFSFLSIYISCSLIKYGVQSFTQIGAWLFSLAISVILVYWVYRALNYFIKDMKKTKKIVWVGSFILLLLGMYCLYYLGLVLVLGTDFASGM